MKLIIVVLVLSGLMGLIPNEINCHTLLFANFLTHFRPHPNEMSRANIIMERLRQLIENQNRALRTKLNELVEEGRRKIIRHTLEPTAGQTSVLRDLYNRF